MTCRYRPGLYEFIVFRSWSGQQERHFRCNRGTNLERNDALNSYTDDDEEDGGRSNLCTADLQCCEVCAMSSSGDIYCVRDEIVM